LNALFFIASSAVGGKEGFCGRREEMSEEV
jgi:hypothetical protein